MQADVANIQEGRIQFTEYSGSGSDASEVSINRLKHAQQVDKIQVASYWHPTHALAGLA